MEQNIKLANLKTGDSDSSLHRKYQELMGTVQGKEDQINRLQTQLAKQVKLFSTGRPVAFTSWRDSVMYVSKVWIMSPLHISLSVAFRSAVKLCPVQCKILSFVALSRQKHAFSLSSPFLFIILGWSVSLKDFLMLVLSQC